MAENRPRDVAIVDDDDAVRESFRFLLELAGFEVATFPSAIAFLEDAATWPRCLILDHTMPRMTGLALVAKLRADGIHVPVLLVTSVPAAEIVARAAELGVERVLQKPPTEEDLIGFVQANGLTLHGKRA